MKYNKPTVEVLDDAVRVIQGNKLGGPADGGPSPSQIPVTVYDLDE